MDDPSGETNPGDPSATAQGKGDINQNEGQSGGDNFRKMLMNGDSEDELVENGLPEIGRQDSEADGNNDGKDDDPSAIERKVNEIFDIFDCGGPKRPAPNTVSDTSSSFSLGIAEPKQTTDDSLSESMDISFEEHQVSVSSSAAAAEEERPETAGDGAVPEAPSTGRSESVSESQRESVSESREESISESREEIVAEGTGEIVSSDSRGERLESQVEPCNGSEVTVPETNRETVDTTFDKTAAEKDVQTKRERVRGAGKDSPKSGSPTPKPSGIPKMASPSKASPGSPKGNRTQCASTPRSQAPTSGPGIESRRDVSSPPRGSKVKIGTEKKVQISTVKSRTTTHSPGYQPGGGSVKIMSAKQDYSKVKSRTNTGVQSAHRTSSAGDSIRSKKEPAVSPRSQSAQTKGGSKVNGKHSPGGGKGKIYEKKEDYSNVSSKLGSMEKAFKHKPGGGNIKIKQEKVEYGKNIKSKIGSMENAAHTPRGGNIKIKNERVTIKAKSRIGSLENSSYSPGGGTVKIRTEKVTIKAKSKIRSLDNASHTPRGGNVKILNEKVDFGKAAQSKVGSMNNVQHEPGGGKVKIESRKLDFKKKAAPKIGSLDNSSHQPGGGNIEILDEKLDFKERAESKVGSVNAHYEPGGGNVQILDEKLTFEAESKIGSLDNAHHQAGGGNVQILDEKLEFTASSKVGSLSNVDHQPGGGNIQIPHEKLHFDDEATARTVHGLNSP